LITPLRIYCPEDKGDAVFKARGLYIQLGGAIDKAWDDCSQTANSNSIENRNSISAKPISTSITDLPKVYPVPTSDLLNVYVPDKFSGAKYRVMNHLGMVVSIGSLSRQLSSINLDGFENGLYFLQIEGKESIRTTLKFIVQK
jgi:hypothetical protein